MKRWNKILGRLEEKFRPEQFNLWIRTLQCSHINEQRIELTVPTNYHKNWIENHFLDDITSIVGDILGPACDVVLNVGEARVVQNPLPLEAMVSDSPSPIMPSPRVEPQAPAAPPPSLSRHPQQQLQQQHHHSTSGAASSKPTPFGGTSRVHPAPAFLSSDAEVPYKPQPPSNLNPRYTFDAFVVGPSNQLTYAACRAVAKNPAQEFNPLFIYGGVGLGKTHIMMAVGNAVISRSGGKMRVIYRSSEEFMNELITSIERKQMGAFREHYRTQCDVLLIDDIQLIAGKERTQEEFFHTFNTLHNAHKQIILSSDKTPQEIPALEERLQSRFSWGLIADIQPPEVETRIAILRKKAARENLSVPDAVIAFLAHNVDTNVRELEGSLRRVSAHSQLTGQPLTIDLVRSVLSPLLQPTSSQLTPEHILKTIAKYFEVSVDEIKGRARMRAIAYPRQVAMYLVRELTEMSYPEIGRAFGKDHTTVISAYQKIEKAVTEDHSVRNDIEEIRTSLLN